MMMFLLGNYLGMAFVTACIAYMVERAERRGIDAPYPCDSADLLWVAFLGFLWPIYFPLIGLGFAAHIIMEWIFGD